MYTVCAKYLPKSVTIQEGLNGVTRQPSNGQKRNRQLSDMSDYQLSINCQTFSISSIEEYS